MAKLAILIPVLRRPLNVKPLVESIEQNTKDFEILFLASPGDYEEIIELDHQNQSYKIMDSNYENNGDYARKINRGFNTIKAEWYFLGADDLRFYPGWFEHAMERYEDNGACVIGTNDLGNPMVIRGLHSTHTLVLGEYATRCGTIDEPGKILHEGYPHEYVDQEFVETARCRLAWTFSHKSIVEHLHPNWNKAAVDSIYAAQDLRMISGGRLYEKRKHLWN
jgi:glycosyltransferase involved in cell wall biosynthesis